MPVARRDGETSAGAYTRLAEELLDQAEDSEVTLNEAEFLVQKAQVYATLAVASTGVA